MRLTTHLTDATLALALDEHGGQARDRVRQHCITCETCRSTLEQAERRDSRVSGLLAALDHTAPELDGASFVRKLSSRKLSSRSASSRAVPWRHAAWSRNTVFGSVTIGLLAAGALAAAVVPGSQLQRLLRVIPGVHSTRRLQSQVGGSSPTAPTAFPRGVAIMPYQRADIVFRSTQAKGRVRIVTGTGAQLVVEAESDGPTYAVGKNTILVYNSGSDSTNYTVFVPRSASPPSTYINVAGNIVCSLAGDSVISGRAHNISGQVVLPLQNSDRRSKQE